MGEGLGNEANKEKPSISQKAKDKGGGSEHYTMEFEGEQRSPVEVEIINSIYLFLRIIIHKVGQISRPSYTWLMQ